MNRNISLAFGKPDPLLILEDMALRFTSEELREYFYSTLGDVHECYNTHDSYPIADPLSIMKSM